QPAAPHPPNPLHRIRIRTPDNPRPAGSARSSRSVGTPDPRVRERMRPARLLPGAPAAGAEDRFLPLPIELLRWGSNRTIVKQYETRATNEEEQECVMAITLNERNDGRLLEVHLTGKLAKEDYLAFEPTVERLIRQHGKIRMQVELHDFHGWTPGAIWEDT